jgi:hypothetical protein
MLPCCKNLRHFQHKNVRFKFSFRAIKFLAEMKTQILVLYEYTAMNSEELSVSEGAHALLLDSSDSDWWLVELGKFQSSV